MPYYRLTHEYASSKAGSRVKAARKQASLLQGVGKDFASPSKPFGLAICLGRTRERLW